MRLVLLLAVLLIPVLGSAQTSWILEEVQGQVRLLDKPGSGTLVKAPPQLALSRGTALVLAPGSSVRVFDGRKRQVLEQPEGSAAPRTVKVPAPTVQGSVLERLLAGAAARRRPTVQGGVLVRAGENEPNASFVWPTGDRLFTSGVPEIQFRTEHLKDQVVRVVIEKLDKWGAASGRAAFMADFEPSPKTIRWVPAAEAFAGDFYIVRLYVAGEEWDRIRLSRLAPAVASMEIELMREMEFESLEELRRSDVQAYLAEEIAASVLAAPPLTE